MGPQVLQILSTERTDGRTVGRSNMVGLLAHDRPNERTSKAYLNAQLICQTS